jgi:hypothetical protein
MATSMDGHNSSPHATTATCIAHHIVLKDVSHR